MEPLVSLVLCGRAHPYGVVPAQERLVRAYAFVGNQRGDRHVRLLAALLLHDEVAHLLVRIAFERWGSVQLRLRLVVQRRDRWVAPNRRNRDRFGRLLASALMRAVALRAF